MKKEFTASGEGIVTMLEFCYLNGLTRDNSILECDGDKWSVRYIINEAGEIVKPQK